MVPVLTPVPPPRACDRRGLLLASLPQDCTTRLHDLRMPNRCLALLLSNGGAIRSLRFSDCGNFLAAAEPADFVTVFDASAGCVRAGMGFVGTGGPGRTPATRGRAEGLVGMGCRRVCRFVPLGRRFFPPCGPVPECAACPPWTCCRYRRSQLIDLFGELAGIAFVPGGSTLNIAVADLHYSSVIQYHKRRDSPLFM